MNTRELITLLEDAVSAGNKNEILRLYDEAKDIDMEDEPSHIMEEYDELVEKGNAIIYKY